MIQIYYGNGKGKTSAAFGAALRAMGHEIPVVLCQFLKDGKSGEVQALQDADGQLQKDHSLSQKNQRLCIFTATHHFGFFKNMSEKERDITGREAREIYREAMDCALNLAGGAGQWLEADHVDGHSQDVNQLRVLLVMDEVLDAVSLGLLEEAQVITDLKNLPPQVEFIMTGHRELPEIFRQADYITRMESEAHPFEQGIGAREGIEF